MNPTVNFVFLAAGIVQTIVIGAILWRKQKQSNSTFVIITFIAALTIQAILAGPDWAVTESIKWSINSIGQALPMAICALSFLYIKYSLSEAEASKGVVTLFLPFIYYVTLITLIHVTGNEFLLIAFPGALTDLLLQTGIFIFFLINTIRLLISDQKYTRASKIWLEEFAFAAFVTNFTIIAAFKFMFFLYPDYQEIRYMFFALPLLIYWVTYKQLVSRKPELIGVAPPKAARLKEQPIHSNLSNAYSAEVEERLIRLMTSDRLFIDPALTIDAVCSRLNIPRHHLTQVLEERIQKSFIDFVNEYRIELATEMLLDPKYNYLTMAAIGFDSGFNSISSFNLAFKKIRNSSPAAYKKKHEVKKQA